MSNPIQTEADDREIELEVDTEEVKEDAEPPVLEVDEAGLREIDELTDERAAETARTDVEVEGSADETAGAAAEENADAKPRGRRRGLIALVLFVLLAGSVVLNVEQARQSAALEASNARVESALLSANATAAAESARADAAEEALIAVDGAAANVQERIAALQAALTDLAQATER